LVDLTDLEIEAFGDKFELVGDDVGVASGLTRNEVINAHGEKLGQALLDSGFSSLSAIAEADDKDLMAVPGVGKATLEKLRS